MVSYADRDEIRDRCGFLEDELVLGKQVDSNFNNSIHLLQEAIAIDLVEITSSLWTKWCGSRLWLYGLGRCNLR